MITRLRIRLAPQSVKESDLFPGKNTFPFDPTKGPGYVWHCHILDHEDNDMMRPMEITFDDLPCLDCEASVRKNTPGTSTAAGNATHKPAHSDSGSAPASGQMNMQSMPAMRMRNRN